MPPQQFNDGLLKVYTVTDGAEAGETPKDALQIKAGIENGLRYEERTVGMSRFFTAMQAKTRVDYLVRCQRVNSVSLYDVVTLVDGEQYKIVQVQYPSDVLPRCMDLSLERLASKYEFL